MGRLFEIRQLEAPRRHLLLRNRAVPQQGFRFTLEQRGEVRWQVGTGEGEAILSGSMLPETEFEFSWKKQTLGDGAEADGSRVETVEDLVRLVWQMVSESVLVTVTWEAWELLGVLKRIEVPINNPGEYAVALTVEWVKEGERNQRRRPRPAADYNTTVTTFADGWSTALRSIRRPLALAREAQQRAESSIVKVNGKIREMIKIRQQFRDSVVESINVAGRLAESFSAVASEASTLRGISNEPPHAVMPTDEPAARVIFESYRARLQRAAGGAVWQGASQRRRLLSEARPDVLGRHIALEDEDLRLLAYRTYGRIDAWQDVARFNELTGSTLPAGALILLPRLEAAGIA